MGSSHHANRILVVETYTEGIPRLAALHDSDDTFSMYRRFGPYAARVLVHRELEINELTTSLDKLDEEDLTTERKYRLQSIEHNEQWDATQRDLINKIQEKLSEYCENFHFERRVIVKYTATDNI